MEVFNLVSEEELKQMFIDIDAPKEIQMYFIELTNRYEKLNSDANARYMQSWNEMPNNADLDKPGNHKIIISALKKSAGLI